MVWAESRWILSNGEWVEARCNVPGVLGQLSTPTGKPKRRAPRHEGMFSVVIDAIDLTADPAKKPRRLPALYMGNAAVFAHRSIDVVRERADKLIEAIVRSHERPTYCFHPIRFDDRFGLYGRDLFNRSVYRRRLERLGVSFSADPYPRLTESGAFECDDWGEISPEVVVLAADDLDHPERVVRTEGALLSFSFLTMRFGPVDPSEIRLVTSVSRRVAAVSAPDPGALMDYLRATPDH